VQQLTALSAGDGLVLVAAGLRAVMVVSTKRLMRNRHLSSGALTAVQSSTVFALACVFAAVTGVKVDPRVLTQVPFVEALLFLSILCTIAAFYIQNLAVRRSSPTKVSFLMSTEPVFGLIFASMVLAEPISARALAGGAMILSGTIIGILGDMGTRRRTTQTVDGSAGPLTT
jgi:drug/metabolite transporter (DMT)-like permease